MMFDQQNIAGNADKFDTDEWRNIFSKIVNALITNYNVLHIIICKIPPALGKERDNGYWKLLDKMDAFLHTQR